MPAWGLQLIIAAIPLIKTLIEKFVPDNVHKKREFRTKKKVINAMDKFRGKTLEEIAKIGARDAKLANKALPPKD